MSPAGLVVNYNFIQLTRIEILRSSVQPPADRAPAQVCSERCVKIGTAPPDRRLAFRPTPCRTVFRLARRQLLPVFLRFVVADPKHSDDCRSSGIYVAKG